jgi:hypothetical protein
MYKIFLSSILLAIALSSASQPAGRQSMPQNIKSPEVSKDNMVTFRFRATESKIVKFSSQFITEPKLMTKDESGLWSITLGPLKSDIYPYCFLVDGIQVMDPNDPVYFPNERFKNSLVDVAGETPMIYYSLQDVPHGSMTNCDYYSKTMKSFRPLVIYTPPGYENNPGVKYPTLTR